MSTDAKSVQSIAVAARDGAEPKSTGAMARALVMCRQGAARAMWATLSLVVAGACGVLTGLRGLDGTAGAPWIRAGVLLGALVCLAAVAAGVSRTLAKITDREESQSGVLLRKDAIGPYRRWAIWTATVAASCLASYLLNEHRPATPDFADLLPRRAFDLAIVACGIGLIALYVRDVAAGVPTRSWPWSSPARTQRPLREDDDVMGAIGRMSPPLLIAIGLALLMLVATCGIGAYRPEKLLGGFGVLGLFGAGLFAAPTLLRAQGEAMEAMWLKRWYPAQWRFMLALRPAVSRAHKIVVVAQVALLGVALGAIASGSERTVVTSARLVIAALIVAICGSVLARVLWVWAVCPTEDGPICTDVLSSREHDLTMLAGWALAGGSVCSLAAVLLA